MSQRLIVFDCDGTLVDSQHMVVAAMAEAFAANHRTPPRPRSVRRVVGLSLADAIRKLAPDADDEQIKGLAYSYRQAFKNLREAGDHADPLFPGALDALNDLRSRGIALAVATGKSRRGLEAVLKAHGLTRHFFATGTADDGPGKPHPGMLQKVMAECDAAPATTVMVGDTVYDVQMARNAHVPAIGVSWGYHEVEELTASGAECIIDRFDDLLGAANRLMQG